MTFTNRKICYIIANFGGPRHLEEVYPFLKELLTDRDVVRTNLPKILHRLLFTRIAKKRSLVIVEDYKEIGGKSPIYGDTEAIADALRPRLSSPIIAFHRYIPDTHRSFIEAIKEVCCDEYRVFPMFPQFTYATTGSIARWFKEYLPYSLINKMRWIKSYPAHPSFIQAHQCRIREFLTMNHLKEEETALLFSAHGVPKTFVVTGDIYESECVASFENISKSFPRILARLSYQSKFGPGEWLRPYTADICKEILNWNQGRQNIAFVPISFTSDHIETLFEIEKQYMPLIKEKGLNAYRIPALTLHPNWIDAIVEILKDPNVCHTQMLIRPSF